MIKLIALDIDGTLHNKQHQIPPQTKQALHHAAAKGIQLVLATGKARPQTVPDNMLQQFREKNSTDQPESKRERFPKPPPRPENTGNIHMLVEWRDIDPNKHVNNAAYFSYIENGTMRMCAEQYDWPASRMTAAGFAIVARRYRLEYREPAVMGDTLILNTWLSDLRRATAVRHYELSRVSDGALCVRAQCLWVWVDAQTQKPIRIPKDFTADFANNVSGA